MPDPNGLMRTLHAATDPLLNSVPSSCHNTHKQHKGKRKDSEHKTPDAKEPCGVWMKLGMERREPSRGFQNKHGQPHTTTHHNRTKPCPPQCNGMRQGWGTGIYDQCNQGVMGTAHRDVGFKWFQGDEQTHACMIHMSRVGSIGSSNVSIRCTICQLHGGTTRDPLRGRYTEGRQGAVRHQRLGQVNPVYYTPCTGRGPWSCSSEGRAPG